jgi:hypothetical protein
MDDGRNVQRFMEWRAPENLGRSRAGICRGHDIFIGLIVDSRGSLVAGLQTRVDLIIAYDEAFPKAVTATLTSKVDSAVGLFFRIDFGRGTGS